MARRDKDDDRDDDRDDNDRKDLTPAQLLAKWLPAILGVGGSVGPAIARDPEWLQHGLFGLVCVVVALVVHGAVDIIRRFFSLLENWLKRVEKRLDRIDERMSAHDLADVDRTDETQKEIRAGLTAVADEVQQVPGSTLQLIQHLVAPQPISRPDIIPVQTPAHRTNGEKP